MPFVGHLPEIFFLLILALIVFGPKRMIEMGSSLGRAFRELREQVKDIPGMSGLANLGGLLGDDEPRRTPMSTFSQFSQSVGAELRDDAPALTTTPTSALAAEAATASGDGPIVEGTVAPVAPAIAALSAAPGELVVEPIEPVEPVELTAPRPEE